jgi:hypothetical protein
MALEFSSNLLVESIELYKHFYADFPSAEIGVVRREDNTMLYGLTCGRKKKIGHGLGRGTT